MWYFVAQQVNKIIIETEKHSCRTDVFKKKKRIIYSFLHKYTSPLNFYIFCSVLD